MRILSVFGTRPEAIKMAPVVLGLQADPHFESLVCATAQHREMLDQVLQIFEIVPDYDLDVMTKGQDLYDVTAKVLKGVGQVIRDSKPDLVLVHGDTTTCFAAALAAFYEKVPVGHVEAGLRTGDMYAPFPEEVNRSLVGRLTTHHFAPTSRSQKNLLAEGVAEENTVVTGNTVIDALFLVREKVMAKDPSVWSEHFGEKLHSSLTDSQRKMVLITGHRRENFGDGFINLCTAIKRLAEDNPSWDLVYPVHLNPNVQKPVHEILGGLENIHLIEPQDYLPFVWLMNQSDVILTDSGGVQEEGPSLGKPVLVMRDVTERPEAVEAGTVQLVGTDQEKIYQGVTDILTDGTLYEKMSRAHNPYGDGTAVQQIKEYLQPL